MIKTFKESSISDQWYLNEDGIWVATDEATIQHLWNQWVQNMTATKKHDDGYNIYSVDEPLMKLP